MLIYSLTFVSVHPGRCLHLKYVFRSTSVLTLLYVKGHPREITHWMEAGPYFVNKVDNEEPEAGETLPDELEVTYKTAPILQPCKVFIVVHIRCLSFDQCCEKLLSKFFCQHKKNSSGI